MNFKNKDIAKKAQEASMKRRHERKARTGDTVAMSFHIPVRLMEAIQQAADIDHRTMSNFVYHSAIEAATKIMGAK